MSGSWNRSESHLRPGSANRYTAAALLPSLCRPCRAGRTDPPAAAPRCAEAK
jgi:hypothetical protein